VLPEKEGSGKNKDDSFWNSIAAGDLASFKTRLTDELRAKSSVVSGKLMILRENINKKQEFGDLIVRRSKRDSLNRKHAERQARNSWN
jgi:hypothetical protein